MILGLAVTLLPTVALNPVGGAQVQTTALLAVSIEELPEQIVALFTVTLGKGFTVTVAVVKLLQPLPSVPATVYVVVLLGVTVMELVVASVLQV